MAAKVPGLRHVDASVRRDRLTTSEPSGSAYWFARLLLHKLRLPQAPPFPTCCATACCIKDALVTAMANSRWKRFRCSRTCSIGS